MPPDFEYDVFLSYSSKDKPAVRRLAERLKGDGLRVWLDEWVIHTAPHPFPANRRCSSCPPSARS